MIRFLQIDNNIKGFIKIIYKPFVVWLWGFVFVTICIALSSSLKPFALKELINFLATNPVEENFSGLMAMSLLYMTTSLFTVVAYRMHNFIWVNLAPPLKNHLATLSMQYVMNHPFYYFQNHTAAKIANSIKELVTKIPELILTIYDGFLCGFLTLIIATATVWTVNFKFAIGLVVWVTVYVVGSIIILKRVKKLGKHGTKLRSRLFSKIVEILENIKCVRLFTREEYEQNKLKQILSQNLIIDRAKELSTVSTFAFQGLSFIIYQGVCLYWLIDGLILGQIHLGDLALVLSINLFFVDYFRKISQNFIDFSYLLGGVLQAIKTLEPSVEMEIGAGTIPSSSVPVSEPSCSRENVETISLRSLNCGGIIFKNVHFSYPNFPPLFQNKSLHMKTREKTAIVGRSGSGKSTFINLILRLYEASSGQIMIDENDIQQLSYRTLRKSISVVPQSPSLFSGSILENIRYGKIEATDTEVIEAAKMAEIDDFIQTLPLGYNTRIDSFGLKLSSGQQQRLAIARAFLKDAPILILDEAMSHLDTITEKRIQEALSKLIRNKTTIFITHHPSFLLLDMDKILVFDHGKIIECGTHGELIVKEGFYKKLWNKGSYGL